MFPRLVIPRCSNYLLLLIVLIWPRQFFGREMQKEEPLSLDEAVHLALQHNRTLLSANLAVSRAGEQYLAAKTQRLPQSTFLANGGELVTRPGLFFPAGSLGTLSDGARVPSIDTTVRTPRRPAAFLFGQVNQPLTQQYAIHLRLETAAMDRALAWQSKRQSEQEVINQARRVYYSIVAAESQLENARERIMLYRELDRLTSERVAQQVSLQAEALEVHAQLAEAEYAASIHRDGAEDAKEKLNVLLGRPLETAFEVTPIGETSDALPDLPASKQHALRERPELQAATPREAC